MKKIRLIKDWDYPDIMRQTPGGLGFWGDYFFTEDEIDKSDALVVLNRPTKPIRMQCRQGNRLLFMQEPPIDIYKWHRNAYIYFDKVLAYWEDDPCDNMFKFQGALPWHINKSYDELKALTLDECGGKQDRLSWVTSNATSRDGHQLRMAFLEFLRGQNYDFELYGKGFRPIEDKFNALFPYKYSLAIENHSCDDYWTEKIADCFLSWTIPIYWGAKNISSYFPEGSIIYLDANDFPGSLARIEEAISSDYWALNVEALARARELVLDKYQFFPQVTDMVSKSAYTKMIRFSIPPNHAPHEKFFCRFRNLLVASAPLFLYTFFKQIRKMISFR